MIPEGLFTHIARKYHICDICERAIPPGDRYWRRNPSEDEYPRSWKEHTNCELYKNNPKVTWEDRKKLNENLP